MRRMLIATAPLVVLLALTFMASAASAKRLVLTEGETALAPLTAFEIYGERNFEVTTSSGALNCLDDFKRNGLELSVLTNSEKKDELEIRRLLGDYEEPCRSFTGNAFMQLGGIGSPLVLGTNGKSKAGPVAIRIEFEHITVERTPYYDVECTYAHKSLGGTNTAGATPQKLEIELFGKLGLDVSNSGPEAKHACPKYAEMDLALESTETLAGENEAIEARVSS
ncbi:MAG TPA: hypothetical protein VL988_02465 [Solirubrobacteraceae bacterium]|nr:hypothetical protein [Solirubrobacteraceae bacterium]